tara:strand:- start:6621 stop:6830 length:210 start_codon:yes stop_codon:yes gene_type:complete
LLTYSNITFSFIAYFNLFFENYLMKKITVFLIIFLALIFASSMIFLTIWEIPAPKKKIEVILQEQDFLQ